MTQDNKEALIAKFDYYATEGHELTILEGESLTLLDNSLPWWKVVNSLGEVGYVPSNFVRPARQTLFDSLRNSLNRRRTGGISSASRTAPVPVMEENLSSDQVDVTFSFANERLTSTITHTKNMAPASNRLTELNVRDPETGLSLPHDGSVAISQADQSETRVRHKPPRPNQHPSSYRPKHSVTFMPPPSTATIHGPMSPPLAHRMCRAHSKYEAQNPDELSIKPGDLIQVLQMSSDRWWFGTLASAGQPALNGWFPSTHVQPLWSHTPSDDRIVNDEKLAMARDSGGAVSLSSARHSDPVVTQSAGAFVMATHPFKSSQPDELSVNANEVLEYLGEHSEDSQWYLCRKRMGRVGLVPRNFLAVVERQQTQPNPTCSQSIDGKVVDGEALRLTYTLKSDNAKIFVNQPWYWGAISREDCERMLRQYSLPGDFLVRDSESVLGDLVITLNTGTCQRNFKVHFEQDHYHIGRRAFPTLEQLILHYHKYVIYNENGELHCLRKPFIHPGLMTYSGLVNSTFTTYIPAVPVQEAGQV